MHNAPEVAKIQKKYDITKFLWFFTGEPHQNLFISLTGGVGVRMGILNVSDYYSQYKVARRLLIADF